MTDGTMAIPVSPVTEEDMGKVRHLFDQALNALVGMSQLSKDVEALRSQVGDLTNQVNRYRTHIDTQDDMLYRTRQERDNAVQRASFAETAKIDVENRLHEAEQSLDSFRAQAKLHDETVARLNRESDDHLMRALEAEDKLATANKKLEEVREHLKSLFPEVTPIPQPVAVVEPTPQPENVTVIPVVKQEPHPDFHPVTEKPWWEKENELSNPIPSAV